MIYELKSFTEKLCLSVRSADGTRIKWWTFVLLQERMSRCPQDGVQAVIRHFESDGWR